MHIRMYTQMHMHLHTHIRAHVYTHICTHTHMHTYTYIYAHSHTYIHIRIYTGTYGYALEKALERNISLLSYDANPVYCIVEICIAKQLCLNVNNN